MAQDATEIYSGPATTFELSTDGSNWTDMGIIGNASITWTPSPVETGDKKQINIRGLGRIEVDLLQTGNTIQTQLETWDRTLLKARVTAADTNVYTTAVYSYIVPQLGRPNEDSHKITVGWQIEVQKMSDFISFPTDS